MSTLPSSIETKGNEKTEICKTDQRVNLERGQSLILHRRVCGVPGGYYWEFLVQLCHQVLQILNPIQTKKCHFSHLSSDLTSKIHTRFHTWPLRNYVIIT